MCKTETLKLVLNIHKYQRKEEQKELWAGLTDFHLSLDAGFTAVAVVDLRLVIIVHHLDKFARDGGVLQLEQRDITRQHATTRNAHHAPRR